MKGNYRSEGFTLLTMMIAMAMGMLIMAGLVSAFQIERNMAKEKSVLSQMTDIAKAAKIDCIAQGGAYAVNYSDLRSRYPQLPASSPFGAAYTLSGGRFRAIVSTTTPSGYLSSMQKGDMVFTVSSGSPDTVTVQLAWSSAAESPSVMDRVLFTDQNSFSGTRPWPW